MLLDILKSVGEAMTTKVKMVSISYRQALADGYFSDLPDKQLPQTEEAIHLLPQRYGDHLSLGETVIRDARSLWDRRGRARKGLGEPGTDRPTTRFHPF